MKHWSLKTKRDVAFGMGMAGLALAVVGTPALVGVAASDIMIPGGAALAIVGAICMAVWIRCPKCGFPIGKWWPDKDFCSHCGAAIDWDKTK